MESIVSHWCNYADNGNHILHQRKQEQHFNKQTAYTISHQLSSSEMDTCSMRIPSQVHVDKKAIKAGNFVGSWLVITKHNANKYYPDTIKTPKGHRIKCTKMCNQPSKQQWKLSTVRTCKAEDTRCLHKSVQRKGHDLL